MKESKNAPDVVDSLIYRCSTCSEKKCLRTLEWARKTNHDALNFASISMTHRTASLVNRAVTSNWIKVVASSSFVHSVVSSKHFVTLVSFVGNVAISTLFLLRWNCHINSCCNDKRQLTMYR